MKDGVNNQIVDTMFKMFRTMKDTMSFDSKKSHLTMVQFEALLCIKKCKEIQMGEIADAFGITMPTATSLVNKLILTKYAVRKSNDKDRRIVRISLTKQGEKLLEEALKQRKNKIHKMLSYLSSDDKKQLLRILQNVAAKGKNNEKI